MIEKAFGLVAEIAEKTLTLFGNFVTFVKGTSPLMLVAIPLGFTLVGTAIGLAKRKLKRSR